jgi:hypothetical protein
MTTTEKQCRYQWREAARAWRANRKLAYPPAHKALQAALYALTALVKLPKVS